MRVLTILSILVTFTYATSMLQMVMKAFGRRSQENVPGRLSKAHLGHPRIRIDDVVESKENGEINEDVPEEISEAIEHRVL